MGRFTDPIVNLLRSMGVMFSNPPSGIPGMSGVNFDVGNNPTSLQAPDGTTKSFPGAVGPGTGDVNGPSSATIGSFAIYSATTGKLLGELTLAQFYELVDDRMAAVIQPGTNITSIVYDDALATLTINAATQGGGGGGLPPDGTYGNIVVSASGATWTIGASQVINSMFANMAANTVKANITGGAAPPTDVTLAAFQAWLALVANNLTSSSTVAPSKDAVNTGLALKADSSALTAHTGNTSNPHSTTAAQVGLGNVTNESKATMFTAPTFTGSTTLGQDAASALQAVTLQQLQAAALQVGKRGRARVKTTANIVIATGLVTGQVQNGVTLLAGDLVLLNDQTAGAENGVYVAGAVPARSSEYDTWAEFPGSQIAIEEGTVDSDTLWLCTNNDGGTLGVTAVSFTKFNVAGALLIVNALSELTGVAATARTNIGAQASDATLTALAALTIVADSLSVGTGTDAFSQVTIAANQFLAKASTGAVGVKALTDFALTLLDDVDAATMRTTIGAQAADGTIAALAALTIAANSMTLGTGADAFTQITIGANQFLARASSGNVVAQTVSDFALTFLDDADAATVRATIAAQGLDATLTAFAALTIAANSMTLGTAADTFSQITIAANQFLARASTGNVAVQTLSDFALTFLDDANAAAVRTTLGLAIGTNVQAWDADLDAWALKTAPAGTVVGTTDAQSLSSKTLVAPIMSGIVNLGDGAESLTGTAMAALAIDVTKGNNTKLAITADSTFTYSALPSVGGFFYATFANTDSVAHIMTMPSNTTDYNTGVTGTVPWILPAGTRRKLMFESDGTNLIMYGSTSTPPPLNVNVSADKTFTLADAGVQQTHPAADTTARTFTIPSNASVAYPIGTKLFGPNEQSAGALTIAITTDTIALAGSTSTTGSRTAPPGSFWFAIKTATTKWMVGGPGVT